ncbi:multicomponent K+:H+ antiporter subunit G [Sinorhizobium kostiense]|uniref:Multicomponent K+:H+ antiporter subunit G n=1 Tax=Sinorhizobium kostiense TaxID=76747 RepID=A0ABS4R3K9_9HYPH|nr:monovalent cation/H(+) antiporter subunit G [Sinorhizobium kostiense]MBP2237457.1 multicomponent K+:H+ antiporter subunit G [Sinorhizobium kostiense]
MSHLTDLPSWAAILVCALLLLGAAMTLIGSLGLIRLPSFYDRLHAPTITTSGGTLLVCLASILCFAILQSRWIFHELLIIFFITATTPVMLMLLGQAALYRDRLEKPRDVPQKPVPLSMADSQ